ncbi:MAG: tetraacyldisaccharide 4'-kinase [Gemmataceae bacterium]
MQGPATSVLSRDSFQGLQSWHGQMLRGQDRGVGSFLARGALWVGSWAYGMGVFLRNKAFQSGWLKSFPAAVPVVSVGNLTVGGTGKTPMVEFVARFYRSRDFIAAILSRGYGAPEGSNDEALVLEENLPDVPHLQGPDRVLLAQTAVEELESEILVLDDGFQHRRLRRDLDLVLIDATDPWGGGYLLPRGLLREPVSSLKRAHGVVLTRCDQVSPEVVAGIRKRIASIAADLPIAEAAHQPLHLANASGAREALDVLRGRKVSAFCGLGNPQAFRRTLDDLGCDVLRFHVYPDHHPYHRSDVEDLQEHARTLPDDALVLTTHKDLVKLRLDSLADRPLWAVRIGLGFRSGQADMERLLERVVNP